MDGAGAAVAVILEIEGAFYGWGEAGLFVAAGSENFIVAAHRCSVCYWGLLFEFGSRVEDFAIGILMQS